MVKVAQVYNNFEYNDYVYDLETEDGTFQAGEGYLIVKNTDSIYTQFLLPDSDKKTLTEEEYIKKIFHVSSECAQKISKEFKAPIELAMEKVMCPLYLFKKKHYVMLYKENPHDKWKMGAKGIKTVRRDICNFAKDVSNEILHKLLYEKNIKGAENIARERVDDLLNNRVPIKSLVLSKSLRQGYKTKQPHAHLAEILNKRDPMTAPKPGDRIPYVFIKTDNDKARQFEKVEDPEYAIENKLKIDNLYYLEHQLKTAICSLLSVVVTNKNGELFPDTPAGEKDATKEIERKLWGDLKLNEISKSNNQRKITNYMKSLSLISKEKETIDTGEEFKAKTYEDLINVSSDEE